jgi:hypothetical protein
MIKSIVRTGGDSGGFEKEEDGLIKSHVSKGMDRQPFSTPSELLNRDRVTVYKKYRWICEHQVRQGADTS